MKDAPIEMAPITEANLPKTVEQQILAALIRIEGLIAEYLIDRDGPVIGPDGKYIDVADIIEQINPTPTPFLASIGKPKKKKK